MRLPSVKLLAATVLLSCGLGLSAGPGWLAPAVAQPPGGTSTPGGRDSKSDPEAELKRAREEVARLQALLKSAAVDDRTAEAARERLDAAEALQKRWLGKSLDAEWASKKESPTFRTAKWEYDLVVVSGLSQTRFREFLQDRENRGWEYTGTTPMSDPAQLVWVFRRPAQGTVTQTVHRNLRAEDWAGLPAAIDTAKRDAAKAEDAKVIEAEIERLTARLNALQAKPGRVAFLKDALPLEPAEFAGLLTKLAEKRFGKGRVAVSSSEHGVALEGGKDVTDWATAVVSALKPGAAK